MRMIPLTQDKVAIVDDEDYERIAQFKWGAKHDKGNWYAHRYGGKDVRPSTVYLHRYILNAPPGIKVDHRNGDGLDCQRENIRLATHEQNARNARLRRDNTTGFKGVSRAWSAAVVQAQIWHDGDIHHLGYFEDARLAADAYDAAARKVFGPFARLNFPLAGERSLDGTLQREECPVLSD